MHLPCVYYTISLPRKQCWVPDDGRNWSSTINFENCYKHQEVNRINPGCYWRCVSPVSTGIYETAPGLTDWAVQCWCDTKRIFYRLSSKHSKAPVPRQKEPKQKGHKWKAEDDKEKTMLLILLICNLSCEYALISILCKHPDFNLVWQTIHTNLNVVSSTGVYVRRSITTWLCYKMFSGSCCDLFSTL